MATTAQTFQSPVFSQLDTQQMLAMSYMLHEIAEDMEDYYRVKTTWMKRDRTSDIDADLALDDILGTHEH